MLGSACKIGVASSVSYHRGTFESLVTLEYAHKHGFSAVQLYLDPKMLDDHDYRRHIVRRTQEIGIHLFAHAPALLDAASAGDERVLRGAKELLLKSRHKWVVYHYNERLCWRTTVEILLELVKAGLAPCVENYHLLTRRGVEHARQHYETYQKVLEGTGHLPRLQAVILEFEDKQNPLDSMGFLRKWFG